LDQGEPAVERTSRLTEPLQGADGAFVRGITKMRPALILVDSRVRDIPWLRWTQILKTSAATRRIPIVTLLDADASRLEASATAAGVDETLGLDVTRSELSACVGRWAHTVDPRAMARACKGRVSPLALEGIRLLNQGEFFEAHEALEHAWMAASELEGYLYRALLQFAVGCLHVERDNRRGALKMTLRVREWLDPLPDRCRGVDVGALKSRVDELRTLLKAEADLSRIDPHNLIPIPMEMLD
jgi:predicted metal-dependent hydrolase